MTDERWVPVIVIGFLLLVFGVIIYGGRSIQYNEYVHKCIDAGGIPIGMLAYTKGYGDSWQCVEITRKVELK